MNYNQNYDENIKNIRLKIAMEKNDWYVYFRLRSKYINWMIFSFFGYWLIISTVFIFVKLKFIYFIIIPNLSWLILIAPIFFYKLIFLSKIINQKKEDVVLRAWQITKDIDEITIISGLEKNFIIYYLNKNGIEIDQT